MTGPLPTHDAFVRTLELASEPASDVVCVKHLGDGALRATTDVPSMLTALLAGVLDQFDDELCLRVRAGVHTGPVLQVPSAHGPDVLGHTVNVAARLCALAAPGEILLSGDAARSAAGQRADAQRLGHWSLQHVAEPVEVWALPVDAHGGLIDPVCHMTVRVGALTAAVGGQDRLFCSDTCRRTFLAFARLTPLRRLGRPPSVPGAGEHDRG